MEKKLPRGWPIVLGACLVICCLVVGLPALAGGVGGAMVAMRPDPTPTPTPPGVGSLSTEEAVAALARWKFERRLRSARVEEFPGLGRFAVVEFNIGYVLTREDFILLAGVQFLELAPLMMEVASLDGLELRVWGRDEKREALELVLRLSRETAKATDFSQLTWRDLRALLSGPKDVAIVSDYLTPAWQRSQR
ncbi:MAG: hypothetical protein U0556_19840 [Dehalococcoidia bacterium]